MPATTNALDRLAYAATPEHILAARWANEFIREHMLTRDSVKPNVSPITRFVRDKGPPRGSGNRLIRAVTKQVGEQLEKVRQRAILRSDMRFFEDGGPYLKNAEAGHTWSGRLLGHPNMPEYENDPRRLNILCAETFHRPYPTGHGSRPIWFADADLYNSYINEKYERWDREAPSYKWSFSENGRDTGDQAEEMMLWKPGYPVALVRNFSNRSMHLLIKKPRYNGSGVIVTYHLTGHWIDSITKAILSLGGVKVEAALARGIKVDHDFESETSTFMREGVETTVEWENARGTYVFRKVEEIPFRRLP